MEKKLLHVFIKTSNQIFLHPGPMTTRTAFPKERKGRQVNFLRKGLGGVPLHLCLPETIPVKCPFWATRIHSSTSAYSMLSHGCTPPCQMNVPSAIGKYIGNIKYRQYEKLSQRWKVCATCFLMFPSGTHSRHYWSIKSCFLMSPEWGFSTLLNTGLQLLPSTSRNGLSQQVL